MEFLTKDRGLRDGSPSCALVADIRDFKGLASAVVRRGAPAEPFHGGNTGSIPVGRATIGSKMQWLTVQVAPARSHKYRTNIIRRLRLRGGFDPAPRARARAQRARFADAQYSAVGRGKHVPVQHACMERGPALRLSGASRRQHVGIVIGPVAAMIDRVAALAMNPALWQSELARQDRHVGNAHGAAIEVRQTFEVQARLGQFRGFVLHIRIAERLRDPFAREVVAHDVGQPYSLASAAKSLATLAGSNGGLNPRTTSAPCRADQGHCSESVVWTNSRPSRRPGALTHARS
jgi:hypothetical protein